VTVNTIIRRDRGIHRRQPSRWLGATRTLWRSVSGHVWKPSNK